MPKFLLAFEPNRMPNGFQFIYSPHYLSLILVIRERTQQVALNDELVHKPQKLYVCNKDEQFKLIIIQNNVKLTNGELAPAISEVQFLDEAWEWYSTNMITQE
ncbi:MAG: hypothetical protein ACFNUV_04990 [Capnocytophaga endodontalis]